MADTVIKTLAPGDPIPEGLLDLYRLAFPPEERRLWADEADIQSFRRDNPAMHMRVIEADGEFAGFMIYWSLTPTDRYVEHLATLPSLRGRGLGAKLIESLRDTPGVRIMLEVEPPADELTRRRVGFYNRLGLMLHSSLPYTQPPYSAGQPPVRLCLMTDPEVTDSHLADTLIPRLHHTVYHI